ncbi:MAG: hypothetical protein ACP5NP_01085 [Acetobacteraceae bacterium]
MLDVILLTPGTRLRIAGGLVAEVVENLGDGEWLRVRVLEPAPQAETELCHATDILETL